MSPNTPDFEAFIQNALGIRLAKVKQSAIKFTISKDLPNAKVIRRTTVISVIEKRGQLANLPAAGGLK